MNAVVQLKLQEEPLENRVIRSINETENKKDTRTTSQKIYNHFHNNLERYVVTIGRITAIVSPPIAIACNRDNLMKALFISLAAYFTVPTVLCVGIDYLFYRLSQDQ